MNRFAIKLDRISKQYPLQSVGFFTNSPTKNYWALKNVNLRIKPSERVGLIGPNGSGKTTLLKIIAGIIRPTSGNLHTFGIINGIFDLNAGFHPELSGEENIYLSGQISGIPRSLLIAQYNRIVDFAEIGDFIKQPLYTYSSGMKFRLAFSIAINTDCSTLILDESFSVGDLNFQQKTLNIIRQLQQKKSLTTIISSHIPRQIWTLSDTQYQLIDGQLKFISPKEFLVIMKRDEKTWKKIYTK